MTVRSLLAAVVLAWSCSSPPPPPVAGPAVATAPAAAAPVPPAVAVPAPVPAPAAAPAAAPEMAREYRDDPAKQIDPSTVGSGKHFLAVSESPAASKVGRDMLAAGGNAV